MAFEVIARSLESGVKLDCAVDETQMSLILDILLAFHWNISCVPFDDNIRTTTMLRKISKYFFAIWFSLIGLVLRQPKPISKAVV